MGHTAVFVSKSNRKAMTRNWSNQKANPALKTKNLISDLIKWQNEPEIDILASAIVLKDS